jgi:hypothetical protein
MSDEIVAAIISALVSGLVSAVAIFVTVRSSREQREHEAQLRKKQEEFERATSQAQREHEAELRKRQEAFEQSLELEKNRLSKAQEEEKARRDYEYEARKHLYSEIQPLLFQLKELSESAYRWVISLARTARQGQLSWLSKGYYLSMTIYRFTAPLAVFRLIHGRLTIVDFSVDQPIRVQYNIAKQSYLSISDGFSIARAGKDQGIDIDYEPHEVQRRRRREPSIPSVHAQQHLFRGHLDKIADALVTREPDGPRCMTYGEFEEQFNDSRSNVHRATHALADGFREFTPQSRPVVWRMLIVQVYFPQGASAYL